MTTRSENITLTSDVGVLTALRALAAGPSGSIADAHDTANRQATHLRGLLPNTSDQFPASLTGLIPRILVAYIDTMPVPGSSFWATGHWHIHIRASDPAATQTFTVLHELKHIIDHPLRRHLANPTSDIDWEAVANHFARQVLAREPIPTGVGGTR